MCLALQVKRGTETNAHMGIRPRENSVKLQTRAGSNISREEDRRRPREVIVAGSSHGNHQCPLLGFDYMN